MVDGQHGNAAIMKKMPVIAIRVDASEQIGTGHFMRCLTLADELKQHGVKIRFVSRYLTDHSREMLRERGYEFIGLNSKSVEGDIDELTHAHWLGGSQQVDAKETISVLSDSVWDWMIVDHYALDARWETMLRESAKHILVIDDLADREHDCDVLLDQNFHADMETRYQGRVPSYCQLLLGPHYVLLREEFQAFRNSAKIRTGSVKRLLVIFGGVDADNLTGLVLEVLANLEPAKLEVDVVIGAQHPCREQIISDCSRLGYVCHLQTNRMAELMQNADLAIGACGFTSYEFAAMKLPAILIPVTEIQASVAQGLSNKGVAYGLPLLGANAAEGISAALNKMMASDSYRTAMSLACQNFLDADGVDRVVDKFFERRENHE